MNGRLPDWAQPQRTPYMWLAAEGGPLDGVRIKMAGGLGTFFVYRGTSVSPFVREESPESLSHAVGGRYVVERSEPHGLALRWHPE